jgi:uncharacterized protein (DUF58 family)
MRVRLIPGRRLLGLMLAGAAGVIGLLILGVPTDTAGWIATTWLALLLVLAAIDFEMTRRAWRVASPELTRRLPAAFALGVRSDIHLSLAPTENEAGPESAPNGAREWRLELHDHADPSLSTAGLPVTVRMLPGAQTTLTYTATPTRRGQVQFGPAHLRVRSRLGLCDLLERLGEPESRRVYPDFAQVARYAWLAGDRRLAEIGIKTYQRRGEGTDFKQLSEYRVGDPVRHIDWRATLRLDKPIIREYQDERDQCVMVLIDCGRRMRADDRLEGVGKAHFDQVLNAVMLLAYVALRQGDAVGAMTFGTPADAERSFPPRKGVHALNALMGTLYAVQPSPTHSDYIAAARALLSRHGKRSLVIVVTNFRDEDGSELGKALTLLRSRHLVMLASLRERIAGELAAQSLSTPDAALEVAAAHLYEQSRRDAFNRLAARDALMVDAEPERLGVELVNRYHAVKRAGLI